MPPALDVQSKGLYPERRQLQGRLFSSFAKSDFAGTAPIPLTPQAFCAVKGAIDALWTPRGKRLVVPAPASITEYWHCSAGDFSHRKRSEAQTG